MRVAFEISDQNNIKRIKEQLKQEKYFEFKTTPRNSSPVNPALLNSVLTCKKVIQDDEINQIHLVEEHYIALDIGITRILSRCYSKDPTQLMSKSQKIKYELPHTAILFITIIALLVQIHFTHPTFLSDEEIATAVGVPIAIDLIYLWVHVSRS